VEIEIEKDVRVDELKIHPLIHQLYGETPVEEYERLKASILQEGVIVRLEVASDDSPVFGGFLLDGAQRLKAATEIGLQTVPVRIRRVASEADAMLLLWALAARKSYTHWQRAEQEQALRAAIAKQPAAWKKSRGFASGRVNEMIARAVDQSPEAVRRRKKVFFSRSSTPQLKAAVEVGQIPLTTAEEIIREAERRCTPGSAWAHKAVNQAVERHINGGDGTSTKKRKKRAPRHHAFDPKAQDAREFWSFIQQKILSWATAEAGVPQLRREDIRSIVLEEAIKRFRVDVTCAVADLKRDIRRISGSEPRVGQVGGSVPGVKKDLELLGVRPPRAGEHLDLAAIKSAYRRLARESHPDVTSNKSLNKRFIEYTAAYERLKELAQQHAA